MLATIMMRYHRYRSWTVKDFVIVGCAAVLYLVLKFTLPKIFKEMEAKMLDRISLGIAIVAMLALVFAI